MIHIMYFPIAVFATIMFLVGNVLLSPFAYLWSLGHKSVLVFTPTADKKAKRVAWMRLLFHLAFGHVLLILAVIVDIPRFVAHLYEKKIPKRDHYFKKFSKVSDKKEL